MPESLTIDVADADIQIKPHTWPSGAQGATVRIGNWRTDLSVDLTREELVQFHDWLSVFLDQEG